MRKKSFELTRGEERIMSIFWDQGRALSSMELGQLTDEFNSSYLHRLLTSLVDKGMIEVNGMVKSGKQYARMFSPRMTREEYAALMLRRLGIRTGGALASVASALIQKSDDLKKTTDSQETTENFVKELESIIDKLERDE